MHPHRDVPTTHADAPAQRRGELREVSSPERSWGEVARTKCATERHRRKSHSWQPPPPRSLSSGRAPRGPGGGPPPRTACGGGKKSACSAVGAHDKEPFGPRDTARPKGVEQIREQKSSILSARPSALRRRRPVHCQARCGYGLLAYGDPDAAQPKFAVERPALLLPWACPDGRQL